MKICFIIDSWFPVYGGGPIHVWEIAKRLVADHECKVDIVTRRLLGDGGEKGVSNESYFEGNLRVIRFGPISKFNNLFGRLWFLVQSFFYLLFSRYDIVNAQAFFPALPAIGVKIFRKFPVVYTVHGTGLNAWDQMRGGVVGKIQRIIEKTLLLKIRYDKVVSVSKDFLQYPNINKDIEVIDNGVNIAPFVSRSIIKNSSYKILFVGRLHPQKGLKYLLRAMRRVVDEMPGAELHIIGTGEQENILRRLAEDLYLKKNVFFRGKIFGENLAREYLSSYLFVLPSVYEGQPLTLLEAWAAKLPVIATKVGGIPNIVDDGVDGFLVDPRNEEDLASAILRCVSADHSLMGERGHQKVKEKFSWEKAASSFFNLYSRILDVD